MKKLLFLSMLIFCTCLIQAKEKKENQQKFQADTIKGVYIPKDLEDCFMQLDQLLSDEDKQFIKELENRKETIMFHFSLGMTMRNEWGLWGNRSRLKKYMLVRGFRHPDDMSGAILEFYYDYLNGNHKKWQRIN